MLSFGKSKTMSKKQKQEMQPPQQSKQRPQDILNVDSMLERGNGGLDEERSSRAPSRADSQMNSPESKSLKQRARQITDDAQYQTEGASPARKSMTLGSPGNAGRLERPPLREFTEALLESFQDLDTAYKMMDLSGNGRITSSEFRAACRSVGYSGDVMEIYDLIDVQGNGYIAKRDFAQLLTYVSQIESPSPVRQNRASRNDHEVKRQMLEQQWARKPSSAKANLVSNAQHNYRT